MLPWLVILAAVLVVPPYLLAPLNVWRNSRSRPIRTRPIKPEEAPAEIRSAVEAVARTLGSSGFRLATVAVPMNGGAVIIHAYHPTTGEHFLDYITDAARWQVLLTTYADGSEVVTSNSPAPSIFSVPPNLHVCTLAPATAVQQLREAHQAHCRAGVSGQSAPVAATGAPTFVDDLEQQVLERQCTLGVYVRDGDVYRPTLRGAFLTTWRLLPPLKGLRAAQNARSVKALPLT